MTYVPALSFNLLTPRLDPLLELFGFGRRQRRRVVELLGLRAGERLLNMRCGTGAQLTVAGQRHPDLAMVGIDVDPAVLVRSRRELGETVAGGVAPTHPVLLVKASADTLPFADASFDAVMSTLRFHHLPTETKRRALREIYRVLVPDGRFPLVDFGRAETAALRAVVWLVRAFRLAPCPPRWGPGQQYRRGYERSGIPHEATSPGTSSSLGMGLSAPAACAARARGSAAVERYGRSHCQPLRREPDDRRDHRGVAQPLQPRGCRRGAALHRSTRGQAMDGDRKCLGRSACWPS